MSEKELYFDGANAQASIFAGDLASNVKLFEHLFNVKIVARDCWIQIRSDHSASCEKVYAILKELNKIHESGYSIHQKDLEFVLSAGNTKSIKSFYAESIEVSPRKNKIIPRTTTQYNYVRSMKKKDIIFGVAPLAFMRGRTLNNSFIILDLMKHKIQL